MSLKYIFSINSGRSGSDYLTELLSKASNANSIHEGFPIMNGMPMKKFNEGNGSELHKLVSLKMKQIHRQIKNGAKIYCEPNHSYIIRLGIYHPR